MFACYGAESWVATMRQSACTHVFALACNNMIRSALSLHTSFGDGVSLQFNAADGGTVPALPLDLGLSMLV